LSIQHVMGWHVTIRKRAALPRTEPQILPAKRYFEVVEDNSTETPSVRNRLMSDRGNGDASSRLGGGCKHAEWIGRHCRSVLDTHHGWETKTHRPRARPALYLIESFAIGRRNVDVVWSEVESVPQRLPEMPTDACKSIQTQSDGGPFRRGLVSELNLQSGIGSFAPLYGHVLITHAIIFIRFVFVSVSIHSSSISSSRPRTPCASRDNSPKSGGQVALKPQRPATDTPAVSGTYRSHIVEGSDFLPGLVSFRADRPRAPR